MELFLCVRGDGVMLDEDGRTVNVCILSDGMVNPCVRPPIQKRRNW